MTDPDTPPAIDPQPPEIDPGQTPPEINPEPPPIEEPPGSPLDPGDERPYG